MHARFMLRTNFFIFFLIFAALCLGIGPEKAETSAFIENSSVGGTFKLKHPSFTRLFGYDVPNIKTGDFNNDGIDDVAVVMANDDKLAIQLGDGEGRLGQPTYISAGDNPVDLDIGDVNLDGELDILTVNNIPQQVNLFVGDGSGNFTLTSTFAAGGSPDGLMVGKFNQDEFPDVAVANANNIKVFLGKGTTSFTQSVQTSVPISPQRMALADFDRDGKQDLLIYFLSGDGRSVRVLKGNGDGTFTTTVTLAGADINGLVTGDFNNDGFTDFILNEYRQNGMKTYFGDGNGNFGTPVFAPVGYFWSIVSGDFNKDGKLDLSSDNGTFLLGDGLGGFTVTTRSAVNGSWGAAVGDFNSDGMPDVTVIAGLGIEGNATALVLNDGTGRPLVGTAPVVTGNRLHSLESADFNLDGKPDLISADGSNASVFLHLQDNNGIFNSTNPFGISLGFGAGSFNVAIGDFNEDNKPDFAAPWNEGNRMQIFLGSGTGTFTRSSINYPFAVRPHFVQKADFNNDGHEDLVTTNEQGWNFHIFLGDGAGNFTFLTGQTFANQGGPNYVTVGDYNTDGKQDLIVSRFFQNNLLVFLGNGNGTFTVSPTQISSPVNTILLDTIDLNNDAKPDLVHVTGENPSTLRISFGNGNGTFAAPTVFPLDIGTSRDLAYEDFDLDGIRDILIGAATSGSVVLFKGIGSGGFVQQQPIWTTPSPYTVVSKDLNGDGRPDVATGGLVGGLRIFLNDSSTASGLAANDISVTEGNDGTSNAALTVNLASPNSQPVSVNYKIIKRTAEPNIDYIPVEGQLTFAAGTTSQTVNVQVRGDALDEDDETFVLSLSNATNAVINDSVGVATVIDDDAAPSFSTQNVGVTEGHIGTVEVAVPAVLSVASGRKVKVQYMTSDNSATAPSDYMPSSGVLYFAPGTTSKNIKIIVNSDRLVETDENFSVNFANPVNTVPTSNQSLVTIFNDDFRKNVADFDGDGKADLSIFRPSVGEWWFLRSADGSNYAAQFGSATDRITPADFTGDGKTDIAFFRPENGEWFVLRSEDSSFYSFPFGTAEDIPLVGDFDADGKSDTGVFRPSAATWYIRRSSDGGVVIQTFGQTGDVPVAADYDGDGKSDIAIYRVSAGEWWIQRSTAGLVALQFGASADKPVQADYTGDGKADVAFWRPSTGEWFVLRSEDQSYYSFPFGSNGDIPAPGDYDGDGKFDVTVFRPSSSIWYSNRTTAGTLIQTFGQAGDKPVSSAFVP